MTVVWIDIEQANGERAAGLLFMSQSHIGHIGVDESFTTAPVLPLSNGDSLPANFVIGHGCNQGWDVRVHAFVNENRTIKYPVVGIVNC